jgi:7SK snRNA methylphosphate capping enzyme
VGQVTLNIARKFEPKTIVGIDIDPQLIFAARKNIRSFVDKIENETNKFPASFKINYGPLMSDTNAVFPKNVFFTQVLLFL